MPGYLGNFPNAWVTGKFPKCLGFYEISQVPRHFKNFHNLKKIPPSNIYRNLRNFPNAWVFGKFPRYPDIWEISKIPRHLGNFPNTCFIKKCKCCRDSIPAGYDHHGISKRTSYSAGPDKIEINA